MDDELRQLGAALVAVPSMPDEEFGQVCKLGDAEVRRERSLFTPLCPLFRRLRPQLGSY